MSDHDAIRPQYHFRRVGAHVHIWNVIALLKAAQHLPVLQVPLSDISEIDEPYWYELGDNQPTCRSVMEHARQIEAADLKWPILLCADGRVMDGMHRVLKAVMLGHSHIAARQLTTTPPPDHVDVSANDLPY